jgi:hypothetical protein
VEILVLLDSFNSKGLILLRQVYPHPATSSAPSSSPSDVPSSYPSVSPSLVPSSSPSDVPSSFPSCALVASFDGGYKIKTTYTTRNPNVDEEPRCIKAASFMYGNRVVMQPRVTPQEYAKHQVGKKYGKTPHMGRSKTFSCKLLPQKIIWDSSERVSYRRPV